MWYKRYKSGEHEYKLAYLLFEWGINTKIKISWYRPSSLWLKLHALTTVPVEMWTYIQAWKLVFRSNTFELMKTFQKIWYQPISARKWTSKKSYQQKRNWKFPRFPSFRFWPDTEIENSKIFTTLLNSKECVLLEEVGNFQGFLVFAFGANTEIENSENLEIFAILVNSKEWVLLEEVGNFRGFRVFDFGPYTEIENSENSEIFTILVNSKEWVLLEEVWNFRGFRVFNFGPYTEIENSENSEIFTTLVNSKECVLPEEVGHFRGFRVFDFDLYTEIENLENSEILC